MIDDTPMPSGGPEHCRCGKRLTVDDVTMCPACRIVNESNVSDHIPATPLSSFCTRCLKPLGVGEDYICDPCEAAINKTVVKSKIIALGKDWPARHVEGLGTYEGESHKKAVALWYSHFSRSSTTLIVYGSRGRGKTGMATYWAWRRGQEGKRPGTYATAYELFARIRRSWHPTSKETEWEAMQPYKTTPYLVIDQLHQCRALGEGEDKSAVWERMALAEVLDHRYRDGLTTILIATLDTEEELRGALDPDILDRVKEDGGIVKCTWGSYR